MRLFIAIEIPPGWRDAAHAAEMALEAALAPATGAHGRGTLRLVDPALMHLTLRFLGEVADGTVPALRAALDREVPPVDVALRLGAAGTFGPPPRTSVAWLGIDGEPAALDALEALVARVEHAVVAADLPPETRPFRAHLTLARVARRATAVERREVAAAVAALAPPDAGTLRARAVALVRSYLGGPQPRYEVVSRHG